MRRAVTTFLAASILAEPVYGDAEKLARLVKICAAGQCQNAVAGEIARLENADLSDADLAEELGLTAMALYQAARTSGNGETRRRVTDALVALVAACADAEQQQAFLRVADGIATVDTELYELDDPFSVSPS